MITSHDVDHVTVVDHAQVRSLIHEMSDYASVVTPPRPRTASASLYNSGTTTRYDGTTLRASYNTSPTRPLLTRDYAHSLVRCCFCFTSFLRCCVYACVSWFRRVPSSGWLTHTRWSEPSVPSLPSESMTHAPLTLIRA